MIGIIIAAVLGLGVGCLATRAWASSKVAMLSTQNATIKGVLGARDVQISSLGEALVQERAAHESALAAMQATFVNMANQVVATTVDQFNRSQAGAVQEREAKLNATLKPLENLLAEYKRNLSDYNASHTGALHDVQNQTAALLDVQEHAITETRRLSQLLGRGDQRGHWGEIQLENVMAASGLKQGIDYSTQVSGTDDAGRARRPDCVVNMPGGLSIAVDAKFPFDAFEKALDTEDQEEKRGYYSQHAAALKSHVRALANKSYWEVVSPSPEFVVCFIPSDFAITAAFDADPSLHAFASRERVLIAGPTNLLSLLWSAATVTRMHDATLNAQEILKQADTIVDRLRLVAEPIVKMGVDLGGALDSYNKMIRSVEGRLLPAVRNIHSLGGARASKLSELTELSGEVDPINTAKWGVDQVGLFDTDSAIGELDRAFEQERLVPEGD
jgi:DNA recombination protein RmuC